MEKCTTNNFCKRKDKCRNCAGEVSYSCPVCGQWPCRCDSRLSAFEDVYHLDYDLSDLIKVKQYSFLDKFNFPILGIKRSVAKVWNSLMIRKK